MSNKEILVIEDDMQIRAALKATLEAEGYSIRTAIHGRDAIDQMRQTAPPSLILLDLLMPVMNGWDFLTELRAKPHWREIPVVVVSAYGSEVDLPEADEFLKKPIELHNLLKIADKYCG